MIDVIAVTVAFAALLYLQLRQTATREKEWALERGALLQRIQAPELAVTEHARVEEEEPHPYVSFDNDEEFWEAKRGAAE